ILIGALTPFIFQQLQSARRDATLEELDVLKNAVLGDARKMQAGRRTDFGYLGDMGRLPGDGRADLVGADKLKLLVIKDTQALYAFFQARGIGAGWNGPYVTAGGSDDLLVNKVLFDGFLNQYQYEIRDPAGLTDSDFVAKITSAGPNKVSGDSDDIILQILKRESFATVFGLVAADPSGQPVQGIPVTIFLPDAKVAPTPDFGIIVQTQTLTDAKGTYQFSNIPFGERSLSIAPKLVLAPNSAKTVNNGGDVQFTVTNFSASNVDIVSVTVTFKITAFFDVLKVDDITVVDQGGKNLIGSGVLIPVSPAIIVPGSGVTFTPVVVQVDVPRTRVKDIPIAGSAASGTSVLIEINGFSSASNPPSKKVDVTGVAFTVIFGHSDATQSTVTVLPQTRG
ncbi:MAG: hypothetical protein HYZ81_11730, partial [Nitrospinae bacterium]|nr:hypothetical protein [Nitrospinota bacterium]